MGAHLEYARALAGLVTGSLRAPSFLSAIKAVENEASDLKLYRGAFMEAAEVLAGDDPDVWHSLLVAFVSLHGSRLLEFRDGEPLGEAPSRTRQTRGFFRRERVAERLEGGRQTANAIQGDPEVRLAVALVGFALERPSLTHEDVMAALAALAARTPSACDVIDRCSLRRSGPDRGRETHSRRSP